VGAAPAAGACNPGTGRPRVAVRPYYGGLPSMAGRGADEGGRKPAGSGAQEGPVRARKLRPRGLKKPRVERRKATRLGLKGAAAADYRGGDKWLRLSVLHALAHRMSGLPDMRLERVARGPLRAKSGAGFGARSRRRASAKLAVL
jgi:hypothetical protein